MFLRFSAHDRHIPVHKLCDEARTKVTGTVNANNEVDLYAVYIM